MAAASLTGRRDGQNHGQIYPCFTLVFLTFFSGAEAGVFGVAFLDLGAAVGLAIAGA